MDPKSTLNAGTCIAILLEFLSEAISLLIFTTTSDESPRQAILIRNELLSVATSLHFLQHYILISTENCNVHVEQPSLSATLNECVVACLKLEECFNGVKSEDRMSIVCDLWQSFDQKKEDLLKRLQKCSSLLDAILEYLQW